MCLQAIMNSYDNRTHAFPSCGLGNLGLFKDKTTRISTAPSVKDIRGMPYLAAQSEEISQSTGARDQATLTAEMVSRTYFLLDPRDWCVAAASWAPEQR